MDLTIPAVSHARGPLAAGLAAMVAVGALMPAGGAMLDVVGPSTVAGAAGGESSAGQPWAAVEAPWTPIAPAAGFAQSGRRPASGSLGGCRRRGRALRFAGGTRRRVVALTFDDGPAPDTTRLLATLERERAVGTFFLIGRQVPGHAGMLGRMLRDRDAIGNHTFNHANVAAAGPLAARELKATSAAIRRAAGYTPCLFRPPYGAYSRALVRVAAAAGMATILWSVDPRDWSRPGRDAIEQRILTAARNGSIILMHDGGGPREQTLAALPRVIRVLRRRGYGFLTVPQLLGFEPANG